MLNATHGLLELVLEVATLDRSVALYGDVLGMPEVERWPQWPAVWVELGPNEVLGLWAAGDGSPRAGIHGARGGSHVHFACYAEPGSLPESERRLREAGHDCECVQFATGKSSLFVTDPDDNVVELADWHQDWAGRPVHKGR